jgi:hypothetical protein
VTKHATDEHAAHLHKELLEDGIHVAGRASIFQANKPAVFAECHDGLILHFIQAA